MYFKKYLIVINENKNERIIDRILSNENCKFSDLNNSFIP